MPNPMAAVSHIRMSVCFVRNMASPDPKVATPYPPMYISFFFRLIKFLD
jgi:hypothetical protein